MILLEMKMRGNIKRFLYPLLPLVQAIIFKLAQKIFNKPVLILTRKIKKNNPFQVYFNEFQVLRPGFFFTTKRFSVESDSNDFEVENASQRLIQLKRHLVSQSAVSKENYLSEMEAIEFYFWKSRGLLSSYNYSEAVSNIARLFLRGSESEEDFLPDNNLEKTLKRLLDHISDNPEYYYFITNNHLLNNARALLLGGLVLRDRIYISRGVEVLNCALFMFQPTGVFRERSSHYHLIIFLWLQDIMCVFNQIRFDGVDIVKEKINVLLAANSEVSAAILDHSSSLIPLIGDVSPDESPDYTSQFARRAHITLRGRDIKTGWRTSGGWCIFRNGAWSAICCPQDNISIAYPTHGHDDWGAFCLSKSGEEILIDIGRYSYSKDPLSLYQVSREGHSSISIELDGKNIMATDLFSRSIHRHGIASREILLEGKALLLTEKYRKRDFQCQWTRRMVGNESLFNIIDTISVSRPCKAVFTFFFSKQWYSLHSESVRFDFGQDNYIEGGWIKKIQEVEYSEEYLSKRKAIRLTFSVNIANLLILNTRLT